MRSSKILLATALVAGLAAASPATAGFIDIGGGWEAEWDSSLDPFVGLVSNGVVGDAVFIEKSVDFTQGSSNGFFPAVPILFRQTSPTAVANIVIEDEALANSTGEDWGGFKMQILGAGQAHFDPVATLNSGGGGPIGFSISPFTEAVFSADNLLLTIGGGLVEDGSAWFPGNGADDGQLWINIDTSSGSTIFTLKETPLVVGVPAPGALALLALGGMAGRRRRRA